MRTKFLPDVFYVTVQSRPNCYYFTALIEVKACQKYGKRHMIKVLTKMLQPIRFYRAFAAVNLSGVSGRI